MPCRRDFGFALPNVHHGSFNSNSNTVRMREPCSVRSSSRATTQGSMDEQTRVDERERLSATDTRLNDPDEDGALALHTDFGDE